jgi:hypothetical protein
MPKVRMRDTTSLGGGVPLLAGEVYEVTDGEHAHLIDVGLATNARSDAQTYAEKQAQEAEMAPNAEDGPPMNPEIARQVAEAGTREGDRSAGDTGAPQRQPLNAPPARPQGRGR